MDPKAENFNPEAVSDDGTCTFIAEDGQEIRGTTPDLRGYVTTMLSRVWGNAITNQESETTFKGKGYPFTGDIVSRRDIEKLVGCLSESSSWQLPTPTNVHCIPQARGQTNAVKECTAQGESSTMHDVRPACAAWVIAGSVSCCRLTRM